MIPSYNNQTSDDQVKEGGGTAILERSNLGRTKFGDKNEGTEACHIVSFELTNFILESKAINLSENEQQDVIRILNENSNLRIKTSAGNRNDTKDGKFADQTGINDRDLDKAIIQACECKGKLSTKLQVERMKRQWKIIQESTLPQTVKEAFRENFSNVKGKEGVLVRSNATLHTGVGVEANYEKPHHKKDKFYKAGQAMPGGEIAPSGGIWHSKKVTQPIEKKQSSSSTLQISTPNQGNSTQTSAKFNKKVQCVPEGQAPPGGITIESAKPSTTNSSKKASKKDSSKTINSKTLNVSTKQQKKVTPSNENKQSSSSTIQNSTPNQGNSTQTVANFFEDGPIIPDGVTTETPSSPTGESTSSYNDNNSTSYDSETNHSSSGGKFYKGGQFIPGGGRAPAGGITISNSPPQETIPEPPNVVEPQSSPPNYNWYGYNSYTSYDNYSYDNDSDHDGNSSDNNNSYDSDGGDSSSGGKFYKGGQFIPGGGRAPAGGITISNSPPRETTYWW